MFLLVGATGAYSEAHRIMYLKKVTNVPYLYMVIASKEIRAVMQHVSVGRCSRCIQ